MARHSDPNKDSKLPFGQELRLVTSGRLGLGRTLWICTRLTAAALFVAYILTQILDIENFKFDVRQSIAVFNALFCLVVLVWWCQSVMRCCIHRTGQGNSVLVSGAGFLLALYLTFEVISSVGGAATTMSQSWYHERINGWKPLSVVADPILGRIVATGDIARDSNRLFETVVLANPELTVVQLESHGGFVAEAMVMARLIRSHKLDTLSMTRCISACTLMFVAGRNRYLGPEVRFGFHRAGYTGMPATETLEELDQEMGRFYRSMGAGPQIVQGELATHHHKIWQPSHGELFSANYATLWWSQRPAGK